MIARILKLIVFIFCSVVVCGCARVQLKNNFSDSSWKYLGKSNYINTETSVCVMKFNTAENMKNLYLVGEATTGFFNVKSDMVSDIPIDEIIHNALTSFFQNMGFKVIADIDNADLRVSGEIQQFWVREYATGLSPEYSKASVRYDIIFKDKFDKLIWARSIDSQAKSSGFGSMMDATAANIPTLKKALFKSISMIANDTEFKTKIVDVLAPSK